MKLSELIAQLQYKVDEFDSIGVHPDEIDVVVVSQPSYPLNNHIGVIATDHEFADYEERTEGEPVHNRIWIGVDQVSGYDTEINSYGPRGLWEMR